MLGDILSDDNWHESVDHKGFMMHHVPEDLVKQNEQLAALKKLLGRLDGKCKSIGIAGGFGLSLLTNMHTAKDVDVFFVPDEVVVEVTDTSKMWTETNIKDIVGTMGISTGALGTSGRFLAMVNGMQLDFVKKDPWQVVPSFDLSIVKVVTDLSIVWVDKQGLEDIRAKQAHVPRILYGLNPNHLLEAMQNVNKKSTLQFCQRCVDRVRKYQDEGFMLLPSDNTPAYWMTTFIDY